MAFKSSKGRDVGKEVQTYQSSQIGQGIGGGGGGDSKETTFLTGGTILDLVMVTSIIPLTPHLIQV